MILAKLNQSLDMPQVNDGSGKTIAFVYMTNYRDWPFGGMLSYIKNILPPLSSIVASAGDTLQLYGCNAGEIQHEGGIAYRPVTSVKTGFKIIPNSIRFGMAILKKRRLFRDVDVVYSHTEAATITLRLVNRKCRIVHHQHGLSYKGVKGPEALHNLERWLAQRLADEVLVVASDEATVAHGNEMGEPEKYFAIGSPIPFDCIRHFATCRTEDGHPVRFVYTGRLNRHKNLNFALEAFAKYHGENRDSRFTIIGDGPDGDRLKRWVDENIPDGSVRFLGRLKSDCLYTVLADSDIMLFPSDGEGVSLSVLEALAAGLPVICRDVVGLNDLVVDGTTGYVVARDSVDEFVEAMTKATVRYQEMAQDCIQFASRYAAPAIAEEIAGHLCVPHSERPSC